MIQNILKTINIPFSVPFTLPFQIIIPGTPAGVSAGGSNVVYDTVLPDFPIFGQNNNPTKPSVAAALPSVTNNPLMHQDLTVYFDNIDAEVSIRPNLNAVSGVVPSAGSFPDGTLGATALLMDGGHQRKRRMNKFTMKGKCAMKMSPPAPSKDKEEDKI